MPLSDRDRIAQERLSPRIVELWRALVPLRSVVSFMNTGAHPDDEMSKMLAVLALRDGVDLSYACSTRGEGGQNDIGTETSEVLGVLRTAEMERAADVLGLRLYWHSEHPDDTLFDFGFSKSGKETLDKWGKERTLKRFVDIVRLERPDIICPTFLDVPGQHGHHRAMTQAAHEVFALAADPGYSKSSLPAWQVKKLYLPAWSGAGQAYDDDLPPPPATLTIEGDGVDPVTGFSYARIGEQSRAFHKTQAMGTWIPAGSEKNWPLHLAKTRVDVPDRSVSCGLPATLADLGEASCLKEAQTCIDAALQAFPDYDAVLRHASGALEAVERAIAEDAAPELVHKLRRKRTQLARVIRVASGIEVRGRLSHDELQPGEHADVRIEMRPGASQNAGVTVKVAEGWQFKDGKLTVGAQTRSNPYPAVYLPDEPAAPCLRVCLNTNGVDSVSDLPLEVPPQILPSRSAVLSPLSEVLNLAAPRRKIYVDLSEVKPEGLVPSLLLPEGWQAETTENGFEINVPDDAVPGAYCVPLLLDGEPAQTVHKVSYNHIAPRILLRPAELGIEVLDVALPNVRVGYVGGGNDRVGHWLKQMGLDVVDLDDHVLASDKDLAEFDAIVIGIFAMRFRPGLAACMPRLHRWCAAGGTLVTLYHRPWDNWDPDVIPPKRLEIGQPSLRWRVTNERAPVTVLAPDHPLLSTPNTIGDADWTGWHKERGLYFARSWDQAYVPLIRIADPDETPHEGALLAADIGAGRHIHCALNLHHQMEKRTPGAYRLMANFLVRR
ncbi:PIG-L family deacetylase [Roseibium marinum]|uniref:GlcNAc-PI de-N-acetylase n=1 Tax=Roseibium marinum TaxID=281252 RepID=A0A2S3UWM1_9HYPH|nr:PIG-L family deacetylase [Roseibium marinum]POF32107.1 GlcNAc-PI de-N-acetylase [Roseibium marinum]